MKIKNIKLIRFLLNILLYAGILITTACYAYFSDPRLFALKDFLVPMNGVIILIIILSAILAGVNEIITVIVIKIRRKQQ